MNRTWHEKGMVIKMSNRQKLIWEDNFNENLLDPTKWNYNYGNWITDTDGNPVIQGWGNNEQQYYTDSPSNIFVSNNMLNIILQKESSPLQFGQVYPYTSAKLDTKGKFSFRYGNIKIRAKLPIGSGLWPAIWMLPEDDIYGAWAASGEIDIVEAKGRLPQNIYGTIHYGGVTPNKTLLEYEYLYPDSTSINDFHVYELDWKKGKIQWLIDDVPYALADNWTSFSPSICYPAPFDQKFYLILNLAMGGWFDFHQSIDQNIETAALQIDYIRVYQS